MFERVNKMNIHWTHLKFLPSSGKDVFNALAIALLVTFIAWYVQYHGKRRRLYKIAAQRKGPLGLPFIGSAWYFMTSPSEFLNKALKLANTFDSPVPVWIGQHLYYGIWKPKDLETVLRSPHALNKNYLYKSVEIALGKGLFTAPASIWKRHKKLILPTFNQNILDDYVEIFSQNSEVLSKQLEKEVGHEVPDVHKAVARCTSDIFCETAMGLKQNAQTKDCDIFKWDNRAMEILAIKMILNLYLPDFLFSWTSLFKEGMDLLNKFNSFTKAVVEEGRLAYKKKMEEKKESVETSFENKSPKRRTFLQQLIESSEEGIQFTEEELQDEVATFLVAGSDTTSIITSFVFLLLGMFSQVQNKVYKESVHVLGLDKPVEWMDLKSLQYMERVIKETMRIFPITPFLFRSVSEDIKLEECTIPAGCSVMVGILALHRDPEVWPNPREFDPDRFLPEEVAKRHPYSYLPFSGGLRSCPGFNFAMMSMKCIIATVIRKYRLFTDYRNIEDVKLKYDLMLKPEEGFKLSLKLRRNSCNSS